MTDKLYWAGICKNGWLSRLSGAHSTHEGRRLKRSSLKGQPFAVAIIAERSAFSICGSFDLPL
jgi:hypothetical protein